MATRIKPVSVGVEGRYKVFYAMAVPVQVGSVLPFEPNHGDTSGLSQHWEHLEPNNKETGTCMLGYNNNWQKNQDHR